MHLQYQSIVNPIFLDNTEEYDMLKSAGLMKLIESGCCRAGAFCEEQMR